MKYSTQRILTTHFGSLPRPANVTELIFAKERGENVDQAEFDETIAGAVRNTVARQVDVGVDIVSDGEMSKISYATYITERISGFEGDTPRSPPQDLLDFPSFLEKQARSGGTPDYKRPKCTGEIRPVNPQPLEADPNNFRDALETVNI
jgi:5-methyltetrahydropteroyltriglutamate--homocysteine methyltransferase